MPSLNHVLAGASHARYVRGLVCQVVQELARIADNDHCYDVPDWQFDTVGVMGHIGKLMVVVGW